jgi:hypothetical protein
MRLDDGGWYVPSNFQKKLYGMWDEFWQQWVPTATHGERYAVVLNGDAVEGIHHGATTTISNNPVDQEEIAYQLLAPIVDRCKGQFYFVRGTEVHTGKSACDEERLARRLGAIPNEEGQYTRWDLWAAVGKRHRLTNWLHHIGTTGSQAYESTAVQKELIEAYSEAARWRREPPDVIVRSHRHRNIQIRIATGSGEGSETGDGIAVVTPAWQGKTPLAYRIPGGRQSTPQFGGILIREAHDELFVRSKVWTIGRSRTV